MTDDFDVAVVGSGFAGSLTALVAAAARPVRLPDRARSAPALRDRRVLVAAREPPARGALRALRPRPRIRPLAAWGIWQRALPEVACGLKRGFTFYGHRLGEPFAADPDRAQPAPGRREPARRGRRHALVPAGLRPVPRRRGGSGRARSTSTGRRSTGSSSATAARVWTLVRDGRPRGRIRARLVVDASGPRGFLHARSRSPRRGRSPGFRRRRLSTRTSPACRGSTSWPLRHPPPRASRRPIPSTTPPCTTSSTAAGSGSCGSRTASRARASRRRPSSRASCASRTERRRGTGSSIAAARRSPNSSPARAAILPFVHRPRAAVPRRARGRPGLGAAAVRRRVRGSAPLDRLPADAARHRAARPRSSRSRGAGRSFDRVARGARPRGRSPKPTRPRAWSPRSTPRFGRLPALRRPHAALLRGGELRGGGAAARHGPSSRELPPLRRSRLRPGPRRDLR